MPAEAPQSTLAFVSEHEGITVAFIGILLTVCIYLWREAKRSKKASYDSVITGLQNTLELQRDTINTTLAKLDGTVDKLEKTVSDLAAELFRDMHSLDRRLSKLEGEHEVYHRSKDD